MIDETQNLGGRLCGLPLNPLETCSSLAARSSSSNSQCQHYSVSPSDARVILIFSYYWCIVKQTCASTNPAPILLSSMSSDTSSRPTSPLSPGSEVPIVRNKLESPAVDTKAQTGRKALQLLSTTHKDAYNIPKAHAEKCTVSCPELNITSDSQEVVHSAGTRKSK